jgi:LPS sulfotransferase NodH
VRGLFYRWRHPTRCYAVCAVARSGSTLLSEGLRATGRAGKPNQFFSPKLETKYGQPHGLDPVSDYAGYVRGIVRAAATPNAVFGCKLMGWDLPRFLTRLRETGAFGPPHTPDLSLLRAALPRIKFIRINRRDKIGQAISKARALQTDIWSSLKLRPPASKEEFDPKLISRCVEDGTLEEEIWSEFFEANGIEPFGLDYEDLCRDYKSSVAAALKFIGVRLPRGVSIGNPITVRQADATSDEWERRYRALTAERSKLLTYV